MILILAALLSIFGSQPAFAQSSTPAEIVEYDGFDRLATTTYPLGSTETLCQSSNRCI
jgi:hypothetical protein